MTSEINSLSSNTLNYTVSETFLFLRPMFIAREHNLKTRTAVYACLVENTNRKLFRSCEKTGYSQLCAKSWKCLRFQKNLQQKLEVKAPSVALKIETSWWRGNGTSSKSCITFQINPTDTYTDCNLYWVVECYFQCNSGTGGVLSLRTQLPKRIFKENGRWNVRNMFQRICYQWKSNYDPAQRWFHIIS